MTIECSLLGDGSSDKMLIPALKWLMDQHFPNVAINITYADIRPIARPKTPLSEKICIAIEYYPCDLLFIHRDVEKESIDSRAIEISTAETNAECDTPKIISVIPCRMSEAWLLIDENAIRYASGNPNGKKAINIPKINTLENLADPKEVLKSLLKTASELNRRGLKKFNAHSAIHRLAEEIDDYSPLRQLPSFQILEESIRSLNWE